MQPKIDADATSAEKVLKLYQRLLMDGRRHYQADLAVWLRCSPQTVIRLITDIERVAGDCLVRGVDKRRRWYQLKSVSPNRLGLDFEELRYLAICRDLAQPYLSEKAKNRVEQSLFKFSMLLADQEFVGDENAREARYAYCAKGWIDYEPFFEVLEKLTEAMERKRLCLIRYKSPTSQKIREHLFAARRIVAMNNALYVLGAGATEDGENIKYLLSLAAHRIRSIELTDRPWRFEIPEADLDMFGLPWHEPRKFTIKFAPGKASEYVRERRWSDKQTVATDEDGALILEMISRSQPEVEAWIRSFGDKARLLAVEDIEIRPRDDS